MKTTKILGIIMLLCAAIMPCTSHAQLYKSTYYNIDWQLNTPVFTDYANVTSGWGMNFEGGYYATDKLAVGLFVSYHTNNKYIGEQLIHINDNSDLYTDQIHTLYQIPFGALLKYRFVEDKMFEPYATVKLGTMYSRMSSTTQVLEFYDEAWGFHVQPEIGFSVFPSAHNRFGLHVGMYYSYSTNSTHCLSYTLNGYNNIGFHVGITF